MMNEEVTPTSSDPVEDPNNASDSGSVTKRALVGVAGVGLAAAAVAGVAANSGDDAPKPAESTTVVSPVPEDLAPTDMSKPEETIITVQPPTSDTPISIDSGQVVEQSPDGVVTERQADDTTTSSTPPSQP
jgi:hypothetical protein